MERTPTRTLPPLDDADPQQLEEALLHWDELDDASLVRLASHRATARRLSALRRVERFLEEGGLLEADEVLAPEADAAPRLEACPAADELYDLGRGPGFVSLTGDERAALESHLARCAECRELVESLAVPPPLPLQLDDEPRADVAAAPRRLRRIPARPLSESRSWLPLVAAAGIAGALLLPRLLGSSEPVFPGLPDQAQLRGPVDEALLFPRGRVLATASGAQPLFELDPVAGATGYRVDVLRHDGNAFSEGERVQLLQEAAPTLSGTALPAGHYTWRAFAEVDGLQRPLGSRDFEVVADEAHAALLTAETPLDERVRALHEAGYRTDARALARELPEGPERDAYLLPPGR